MRPLALGLLVVLVSHAAATTAVAQPPSGSDRVVTVIGDLHMGVGRDASGAWHAIEDFRWTDEFVQFLRALDTEGGGAADLVLNGDTFELRQSLDADCVHDDPVLGCSEAVALARMDRVLAAHAPEIDALAAFARSGSNRIVFVPGEHDAALLFPSVRARVEEALGAPRSRAAVATSGYWVSDDGQLYAEHGHQIGWRADRFDRWPAPFIERSGQRHLTRPWGAREVAAVFDDNEARYPIIDNFADEGDGLARALAADGITNRNLTAGGTADLGPTVAQLLRYVLFRMPWQQFRVDLDAGDTRPPTWDLATVKTEGPSFLVESLPDDHRFKAAARRALGTGALVALMDELSDDELTALCDYRAAVRRARRRFERYVTQIDPRGPPVAECPRTPESRGGLFDYFWRTRDLTYAHRLEAAQAELSPDRRPIAIFVHGHTHLVDWRQRVLELTRLGRTVIVDGFSPVRDALRPVVINGGAWQRTITPVQFGRLQEAVGATDAELLGALRPEHLSPCYSFVRIDPYDDTPGFARILYWREADGGGWEMASGCGHQPSLP